MMVPMLRPPGIAAGRRAHRPWECTQPTCGSGRHGYRGPLIPLTAPSYPDGPQFAIALGGRAVVHYQSPRGTNTMSISPGKQGIPAHCFLASKEDPTMPPPPREAVRMGSGPVRLVARCCNRLTQDLRF